MRYRVRAELAGRRFEEVMVDIGFSDSLKWKPEPIRGLDLLAFADIEPIEVPVLPLEQHIAEKVHAYTKTYSQGRRSSRAKDLVDLVLVKQLMVLDAARLRTALEGVFEGRRQPWSSGSVPATAARMGGPVPEAGQRSWSRSEPASGLCASCGAARSRSGRSSRRPLGSGSGFVEVTRGHLIYCAQFCARCARFCAPTGDQSKVLGN